MLREVFLRLWFTLKFLHFPVVWHRHFLFDNSVFYSSRGYFKGNMGHFVFTYNSMRTVPFFIPGHRISWPHFRCRWFLVLFAWRLMSVTKETFKLDYAS